MHKLAVEGMEDTETTQHNTTVCQQNQFMYVYISGSQYYSSPTVFFLLIHSIFNEANWQQAPKGKTNQKQFYLVIAACCDIL